MVQKLEPSQFIKQSETHVILDVRTPAEFAQGHIPGAVNISLFTNEERVVVGTTYKQQSREAAILQGLDYIGPRMRGLVEQVNKLTNNNKTVLVHCWRGGMRSGSFAWLLQLFGYEVFVLEGGYKAYRALVRAAFDVPKKLVVLGGPTGSGKSELLCKLTAAGEQVVDLEGLARHKGSVFGGLGAAAQPTQEQFENDLAVCWLQKSSEKVVYIEDESKKIGAVFIPEALWVQMRAAPVICLKISRLERLQRLCLEYGSYPQDQLISCALRLEKHLGGLVTKNIVEAIAAHNILGACDLLLNYYDAGYAYGLSKRPESSLVNFSIDSFHDQIDELKKLVEKRIACISPSN